MCLNKINVQRYDENIAYVNDFNKQRTITITIDYTITSRTFQTSDSLTITI